MMTVLIFIIIVVVGSLLMDPAKKLGEDVGKEIQRQEVATGLGLPFGCFMIAIITIGVLSLLGAFSAVVTTVAGVQF